MKPCVVCGQPTGSTHGNRKYCKPCNARIEAERAAARYRTPTGRALVLAYQRRVSPANRKRAADQLRVERTLDLGYPLPARCEICGVKFEPTDRSTREQWDHNHNTGKGRGWLCQQCNTGLGCLGDNPRLLEVAAEYLRTRGAGPTRPVLR